MHSAAALSIKADAVRSISLSLEQFSWNFFSIRIPFPFMHPNVTGKFTGNLPYTLAQHSIRSNTFATCLAAQQVRAKTIYHIIPSKFSKSPKHQEDDALA